MKHPNINLKAIPEGMSIAQAAEILRDQREEERRKLIFGLAMAAAKTQRGFEDLCVNPEGVARDISDYVDALQLEAYGCSVDTRVDPTQILAVEIAEELRAYQEFSREPREPFDALSLVEDEMPGCPMGCPKTGCERPWDCGHQED